MFVCWLPVAVPVTALLPTPPPSLAAIAVAAPIASNDAILRIRIVFVIDCSCSRLSSPPQGCAEDRHPSDPLSGAVKAASRTSPCRALIQIKTQETGLRRTGLQKGGPDPSQVVPGFELLQPEPVSPELRTWDASVAM
jgi:hypothetical protein